MPAIALPPTCASLEEHLQHEAETRLQTTDTSVSILHELKRMSALVACAMSCHHEMGEESDADVAVIGSRNPSITTHLLGLTPQAWWRHATLPVLVVR